MILKRIRMCPEIKSIQRGKNIMKKLTALALSILIAVCALSGCVTVTTNSGEAQAEKPTAVTAKVIDIELTQEEYAYGVDKDQPELLEKVNEMIAELVDSGKFDEICNHYFGDGEPVAVKSAELDTSKDQFVVATNAAFEPFEYMVGEDYYGVDMEIAQYFADQLGLELVISNMEFASVCLSVGEHKCDIAMDGLTVKEDRKELVTVSTSYYNAAQKLIVKSDDSTFDACKTAADVEAILSGFDSSVKVGVQNGTTGQFYMEGDEDWGFDGYNTTAVPYSNGSLAVMDMLNGNISYVVIDSAPAKCITDAINAMR